MIEKKGIRHSQRQITQQIGRNLRNLRIVTGLTQTELGEAVGVTFQQVQKYEKGSNRLNAAALCQFAKILDVPFLAFFEGVADKKASKNHFSRTSLEMVHHFNSLKDEKLKKGLMALIKQLVIMENL